MKILSLISDFGYHGTGRQLRLTAAHWPRKAAEHRIIVFGRETAWARELKALGFDIRVLDWRHGFDLRPWWRLRQIYRQYQPDVLHGWGMAGLRAARALGRRQAIVVSHITHRCQRPRRAAWADAWLLHNIGRVVIEGPADELWCLQAGINQTSIATVRPGVESASEESAAVILPLPDTARVIACIGPLEPDRGIRDAIWAFDILKYLYDDAHLVIVGDGSEREALERFTGDIDAKDRVHFLGALESVTPVLNQARAVWVPSRGGGGVNSALEAMSAGRPVVATRTGILPDVVADGETGLIADPADKAGLARHMKLLLDDHTLQERLGKASAVRAAEHFSVDNAVSRYLELYEAVAGRK